ncbi:MAG: ribonuclease P protein component 4 [Thermoplasmatota archaeon]
MARRRNKGEERHIARGRIRSLLTSARDEAGGPDADLADRYAFLAHRIGLRYKVRLHHDERLQVCRSCQAYRVPGEGVRVRVHRGRIITTCLRCGDVRRRPLSPRTPSRSRS